MGFRGRCGLWQVKKHLFAQFSGLDPPLKQMVERMALGNGGLGAMSVSFLLFYHCILFFSFVVSSSFHSKGLDFGILIMVFYSVFSSGWFIRFVYVGFPTSFLVLTLDLSFSL